MQLEQGQQVARPVPPIARQMIEAWRLDPLQQGNLVSELLTLQYKGKLDDALLERAFQAVVDRHEPLRTGFRVATDSGEITAHVHPAGSIKAELEILNLDRYAATSQEVRSALKDVARREFFENKPPLVRLVAAHVEDDRHVLLLAYNHCVMDGMSSGIFWKDLSAAYNNAFDVLPPLQMTYSDYTALTIQALTPALKESQLNYWKKSLASAPELLDLPVDFPRPTAASYLGNTLTFDIDGALLQKIRQLMAREHQSLLRVAAAAYARVLAYYTGQEEVVLTVPRAVRPPGSENMIGHTVNVMAIRIPIDPKTPFIDSVQLIGKAIKEAVSHSDVPFASVVAACAPMRSAMYLPISQASISVHEQAWVSAPELAGLMAEESNIEVETGRLRGDLQLYVRQFKDKVQCLLFYNSEILSSKTAQALAQKFQIALEIGAENPAAPVVLGLAEEEKQRIVELSVGDQRPQYLSAPLMHESFESAAARSPSSNCLCFEGTWLSYGEVEARASAVAAHLWALGVGPGVVVGLMLDRSFELVISLLGVLKAGGCYLPCDPEYPDDRLQIYLEDGKAKVVLTQAQYTERAGSMAAAGVPIIDVTSSDWQESSTGNASLRRAGPEDPAYIIFTSGSTGRPKGVQIPHQGLRDLIPGLLDLYQLGPKDVAIFTNTVNFDAHVIQVLPILYTGASLVVVRPKGHLDACHVVDLVLAHTVTSFVVSVPTMAREYMAEFKRRKLAQYKPMRAWALGGDAVPVDLVHQMQEFFPNLVPINAYGPTEVSVVAVEHVFPRGFNTVVIGRPDANVLAMVVDSALQPLPVGVPGELLLSGPRLAMGYVGRPDLTEEKFISNPCLDLVLGKLHPALAPYYKRAYRTGDLVRWRSDGTIDFLGRIDRQVKITGVRIELGEVESALAGAPGVEQSQAAAVPDPQGQKRLVGYVTPASADTMAVIAHCRAQLVPAMVPSVVVALDSFPLLPNGKVDTKSLPAPEWGGAGSEKYEPPSNDAESAVQKVFADVLGRPVEELSVLTDFFAAGGTSLQVFRAAALLQSALDVASVPPTLVHTARTARAVAEELLQLKEKRGRKAGTGLIKPRMWSAQERLLSSNQQQMWLLSSLAGSSAYNVPCALELSKMPNIDYLRSALNAVVARHEVLRTRFHKQRDGTLCGIVTPANMYTVPFIVSKVSGDKQMRAALAAELAFPFNLEADPLLRAMLLERRGGSGAVLALTMHHAVGDAWSLGVFWKEVSEAYAAAARGVAPAWDPLPIQYADYAAWQEEQLSGESGASLRAYWKEELAGVPSVVQLPYDHPRPLHPTFAAGSLQVPLPPRLLRGVEEVARQLRVNVQAVLLAALQTVLLRYSGQEDLVIGVPVAGRDRSETHGLVGYFINTLPIRCLARDDSSFAAMIGDASSSMLAALDHSLLPLENIVAVSGVGRVQNVNPLFQILLQYLPGSPTDWGLKLDGIEVNSCSLLPGLEHAKMDLNINFKADAVEAEYLKELFDAITIQRLVHSYIAVLQHIVIDVDATALKSNLLGDNNAEEVVLFSIGDQRPQYLSAPLMHESFESAAARSPSSNCLCFKGTWLSYGEVEARASAVAAHLWALGVGPGVVVGLMLDRSFELVISLLGVLKAGGCYLPCDPEYPDDRLQIYLEDGKAKVVLTQAQYTERAGSMAAAGVPIIDVTSSDWQESSTGNASLRRAGPEDPAYIIFTSGSTGRPKGVQIPHQGLRDLIPGLLDLYQLGPKDVAIFTNTVNFDAHVIQVLPILYTGASLVVVRPKGHLDACHVVDLVLAHTVTSFVVSVPTMAREYMAEFKRRKLAQYKPMRAWALGGDAVPVDLVHQMQEFFPNLVPINAYGPTEVSVVAVEHVFPRGFNTVVIGRPDANVLAMVVDSALQPLPVGVPGELLLSGPRLAMGYVGRPDLTEEKFISNPCLDLVLGKLHPALAPYYKRAYRTGDLVRWRSDGTIDFLGRIDRQVKITGVRIELGEVESALAGAPGVEQSQAAAVPDPQGQKRLVGYVTPASADTMAVIAHCRAQLVPAMVPSVVVALDSFPLLPNGKVDTKSLPAPEWGGAGSEKYEPPSNDAESAVQKVFADVLGRPVEELSVLTDFFAAGGTSLQVFRAAALLQSALDVASVPPTLVHTARTARAVAEELLQLKEEGGGAGLMTRAIKYKKWLGSERPLSSNQEQMWLLSTLGGASAYNMPLAIDLTSMPVAEALQIALDAVAMRHEVLRTRFFRKSDGTVAGRVTPPESFHVPLQVIQITSEKEVAAVVAAECDQPFNLEAGPLLRAKLLKRRGGSGAALALTMHHAVGDAWSLGVFWKEVSEAYAAAARGVAPAWDPLPIQYADYAAWQEEQLSGESGASLRAYWKEELAGVPSVVQLPYDHPRPLHPTFAAGSLQVPLPPRLLRGVEEVARQLRVNVQAVLLAALQTVLLRYSGQEDLVIGVPVAGRDRSETHGLVGYFINTLPIRCLARDDSSFAAMIGDASSSMLAALDHSLLPLENIVAVSGVGRVQNVNPLFQVLFQYFNENGQEDGLLGDIKYSPLHMAKLGQAKLDLTTRVVGNELQMDFMSEVFNEATVRNLLNSYISVLTAGVADIQRTATMLPLIDVSDEHGVEALRVLSCGNWNPAHLEEPMVTVALTQRAKSFPNRSCLVFEGQEMTYGQLEASNTTLAQVLTGCGLQRGMGVGILLERSFELFIAMMAVLRAGGYVVPMDPDFPTDRLAMYAEDTQVHSIITMAALKSRAESLSTAHVPQILVIDDESLQNTPKGDLPHEISPDSTAYVEFTSGSTGRPKGVMIQHHCLASYCASIRDMYSLGPDDCALLLTSINFDPFVRQTFLPLYIGARVVIARSGGHLDADYIMELASTHGVTIMHSVPTLALQYYAAPAASKCTKLRYIGSGGEPLPQQLVDLVHALNGGKVTLYNNYGPTECTVSCTCQIGVKPGDAITVGGPDINIAAYVVDAHMQPVPIGVPGELLISGPRLAQGYIGRLDLTAAAFIPNPLYEIMAPAIPEGMRHHFTKAYRTGDLVRWRSDGTLVCMGRIDRQVKISGVRIELGEVEAALESAEDVVQAMAAAVPDANGHKKLVGYVTPESLDPGAVLTHCRSMLVPAMVPTAIVALESFPLLPNGKVDVRSLPAPDWTFQANLLDMFGEDDGPLDEYSAAVVDTIRQVLSLDEDVRVPLKAELFDLGATSVQIASLVGRIRKQMEVKLDMRQVYLNPQIEFLCKEVRKQKGDAGVPGAPGSKRSTTSSARHRLLGYPIAVWAKSLVSTKPLGRFGTALVQLIGAMIVLAFQFGCIVPGVYVIGRVDYYTGRLAASLLAPIAFLMWGLTLLVLTFLVKWILIGRYKPGTYPLWGWYYLRWWIVHRMARVSEAVLQVVVGTPICTMYLRLMGASIGYNAQMYTSFVTEFDLISIGRNSTIGEDVMLSGHSIERGYLVLGPIYIAENCSVGMLSIIMPHTSLDHSVALAPMSMVPLGTALPPMTTWHGSPVRKREGSLLAPQENTNLFSFKYTAMLASSVQDHPGVAQNVLASAATRLGGGIVRGVSSWLALLPVSVGVIFLWNDSPAVLVLILAFGFVLSFPLYMIQVVALKWLVLGRTKPGKYKATSSYAVRYQLVDLWFTAPLARSFCKHFTKTPLMPLTLRALGAKLGKKTIFYKMHPLMLAGADQLNFGDAVVIGSDALVLGGAVLADTLLIAPTTVKSSTFVADGALVLPGSTLGFSSLVGVQTIIQPFSKLENGSVWAGSPALCLDPGLTNAASSRGISASTISMRNLSSRSLGSNTTRWQKSQRLLAVHILDHAMSSRNLSARKSSLLSRGFSGLNAIGEDGPVTGVLDNEGITKRSSSAGIKRPAKSKSLGVSPFSASMSPKVAATNAAEPSGISLWGMASPLFSQASTIVGQLQEMQGGISAYFTLIVPCLLLPCFLFAALVAPAFIIDVAGTTSSKTLAYCLVPVAAVVFCLSSAILLLACKRILLGRTQIGRHGLYGKWALIRSAALSSMFDLAGAVFLNALMGTPWAGWYLRALGASIGKDVYLDGLPLAETDLLILGDGVIVNRGAKINVHNVENGTVECLGVEIAPEVTLGPRAHVMPNAVLEERSALGALSVAMKGESVDEGAYAEGYPLTHLGTWYDSEAQQPAAAVDAAAVVEEMRRDAVLPSDIRPAPVQAPVGTASPFQTVKPGPPEVVLLTGATGFVGGFILRELLRPPRGLKRVYCLVRCKSSQDGVDRIRKQLLHHELYTASEWLEIAAPRLYVLPGDLGQPSLGLDAPTMQRLADEVDVIINNGAMVNVTRGYAGLKTSNVDAVLELLRLSTRGVYAKPVHQISTGGALPRTMTGAIKEEYINPDPEYLANFTGYDQSKWVAERLVLAAGQAGLYTAVQRLGRVGGDSISGGANESDYCMLLIKGCLQMGCFPANYQFALNIIPGDLAAKVICDKALAIEGKSCGRTYHVTNPNPPPFQLAVNVLKQLGYQFEEVQYAAWRERLFSCAKDNNALRPLELAFGQEPPKKKVYSFDCTNSGIRGNTLSAAHLKRDFEWCAKVGFFPPLPLKATNTTQEQGKNI